MSKETVNRKLIYQWIVERTGQEGQVLDIGCGDGELLARLVAERGVHGTGIEISEECVVRAVQRGLSVHHGNVEEGLDHYHDDAFDLVIMSETIQEMNFPVRTITEAFRVGKLVLVVFANFGYWRVRCQLLLGGRAPRNHSLPYRWYDSPNRHFLTTTDWLDLCREQGWRRIDSGFVTRGKIIRCRANLRAEIAMYLMESSRPQ